MSVINIHRTKRRYATILADPPWHYDKNKRHPGKSPRNQADDFYPTMSMADLRKFPIERLAEEDSHLYLWITNAFVHEGCHLMKAWGFRQVTMVTWVKDRWGTGWHFRGQTEHMLFGVKGSLPIPPPLRHPTVFYAPVLGHSAKPRESYRIVERVSPKPRIELFARRARPDWDSWGLEAKEIDKELERDVRRYL